MSVVPSPPHDAPFALEPIVSIDHPWFAEADALYREAFPPHERRDGLAECFGADRRVLEAITAGGSFAGLVVTWNLGDFTFLEHVATLGRLRGAGIGGAVIAQLLCRSTLLVAEAEPAGVGPIAARRLAMYVRVGLRVNPGEYLQPSYGPGKPRVPMRLLSGPRELSDAEASRVAAKIEREVYAGFPSTNAPGSGAGGCGRSGR